MIIHCNSENLKSHLIFSPIPPTASEPELNMSRFGDIVKEIAMKFPVLFLVFSVLTLKKKVRSKLMSRTL